MPVQGGLAGESTFTKPQWNEWGRLGDHIRNKNLKVMGSIETFTSADARRYHNATYSEADVIGYFDAAGFKDVGVHELIAGSLSRIAGTKAK